MLGTPYIRVLADSRAEPSAEVDDDVVIDSLKALVPYAEEKGVILLVETNGAYADTRRLANLLNEIASDNVAALWDFHHPYRFFGESAETTIQNLGAYIKYCHIKDSVIENGDVVYRMCGEGDLPIESFINALKSVNYDGYISLEWLKKYAPELSDAGIVFPHYANLYRFMESDDMSGRL